MKYRNKANNKTLSISTGFTIVEILVVIVVIGILAAIIIVFYTGVTQKAAVASLQSDLENASKLLSIDSFGTGIYPATKEAANGGKGLPKSPNTVYTYIPSGTTYCISATSTAAGVTYHVTSDNGSVQSGKCSLGPDWLTIGTQTWAKYNLNVGTMVTGVTNQTNNAILEKYCYNNLESNCTTYGALYQWNEAMQYVTTEGAQGICPAGSHIPSDNDWKILEMYLGMTQVQANAIDWRGTDQGTQIKPGGTSGLNVPLAGSRNTVGSFVNLSLTAYLWSSSESGVNAWFRDLHSGNATVYRHTYDKANAFSLRCLGN